MLNKDYADVISNRNEFLSRIQALKHHIDYEIKIFKDIIKSGNTLSDDNLYAIERMSEAEKELQKFIKDISPIFIIKDGKRVENNKESQ